MTPHEDLRIIKGNQTKGAVLTAALSLLSSEGIKGLTAGKLAERSGVSKSNLFHHFKTVDEIPFALLETMTGQFSAMMAGQNHKTVYDYVFNLGRPLIEASDKQNKIVVAFFQFYQMSLTDEKCRPRVVKAIEFMTEKFRGSIEAILKRPLTVLERQTVPSLIAMSLDGMSFHRLILKDKEHFLKVWKAFAKMIANSLEK